jgi:predicted CoA-binding protein
LRGILEDSRTIAVVGLSAGEDSPAHTVPAYLQDHGYRILPVNPNYPSLLGETCYPDLETVPEPVDLVLVFRPGNEALPIVEQAIRKGAKTVWMQEGVVNEQAAEIARRAGLQVVMDTCLRATHQRLIRPR